MRVGRLFSPFPAAPANDNRLPLLLRLRRASYWLAVTGAAGWFVWSNF